MGPFTSSSAFLAGRERGFCLATHGLGIHDAQGYSGNRKPHGAVFRADLNLFALAKVGGVHRDHGRHFGHAVAFQQIDTEGFLELLAQRLAKFFRAHHHEAERGELFPGALAHVGPAKGGGRQQERAFVFMGQFPNNFCVRGVGMVDYASAGEQRQPDGGHETERMKQRQHSDDAVVLVEREKLQHGVDVGRQVEVRQHDAFRNSGAAARKDHRGQAVGIALGRQPPARRQPRFDQRPELLGLADRGENVFEIDRAFGSFELGLGQENLGGDDGADPALGHGVHHRFLAAGEVQVYRDLAGQRDTQVRQRSADGRGQQ